MQIGEVISLVVLGAYAVLGAMTMLSPAWMARIVRLVEDPDPGRPGGFSEFRATFGGLFMFSHMMTAALLLTVSQSEVNVLSVLVVLPLAAGWIGAAFGRTLSLLLDKQKNRGNGMIPVWIPMEFLSGLAIAAPILQFMG
ncbi:hypothetical protein [Hyphomonas chukchiensis]|uniref:DUF4345 domain-containing protein n=1 Tax=Hyphomonas chukchiensis TaxID=1280947 RepID=A0A062UL56_9PROT|nr:hypothetical protein [Hyphomonas chukchiensis]KCZ59410.1 hypothetical protein HY30_14910 [Hyphomonas chukchiensis]